ncbi:hypothetical protein PCNPT3_04965 [Psychromonas sp. CNPT3]|uniref:FeoA family protein n=1 Tax=Psychromonas sp. CNPT3 TaxID=314282 RepID=UPI0002C14D1A|nr:FeoA family protein [Psychromonas sp. CNPT3]AGH80935.1 hypothetical protein PCNPT3_04965 [Psychromonas sp. CNPT3]
MNCATFNNLMTSSVSLKEEYLIVPKNLSQAEINKEYMIKDVIADDKDIVDFLFTLGCFKGETITIISILAENFVITLKDARYSIDSELAAAVLL